MSPRIRERDVIGLGLPQSPLPWGGPPGPQATPRSPILVPRRRSQTGFTLIELIVSFTILLVLSTMALPIARFQVRRSREKDLRYALLDMRKAIDKYKDMCDSGKITGKLDEYCYPPTLEVLVDGVKMNNVITGLGQGSGKVRFLRRIPKDPFTGDTDWGKRSMQDDPTSSSWGGQNVFDVYSKTNDRAPDGTAYAEW
jgi:general secretion pathway protein G